MEITVLPKGGLKFKGKQGVILYNSIDKSTPTPTIFLEQQTVGSYPDGTIILQGPGDYEVSGVKISGIRNNADNTAYTLTIDNITVLLGRIGDLEKLQSKLREHQIAVIDTNSVVDSAFVTGFVTNVLIFCGEKAEEVIKSMAKENTKTVNKYQVTADKLPTEIETVLLAE